MKKRWVVALELQKLSETVKIEKAKEISAAMGGNANFPAPDPSLGTFNDQIVFTEQAYLASRNAGTLETDIFHNKMDELERMMTSLADYVEIQANKHPDTGDEVIDSAGMKAKDASERNVQDFTVKNGRTAGTAFARSKAVSGKSAYIWQYVAADGGDFATAGVTVKATFTFINLDRGRKYKFRRAIVTKDGQGDWSDVIELVIL